MVMPGFDEDLELEEPEIGFGDVAVGTGEGRRFYDPMWVQLRLYSDQGRLVTIRTKTGHEYTGCVDAQEPGMVIIIPENSEGEDAVRTSEIEAIHVEGRTPEES